MTELHRLVTERQGALQTLRVVDRWFGERGFGILIVPEGDRYWVDLISGASFQVAAPRYGRGSTAEEAALSARARFEAEQEGVEVNDAPPTG